MITYYGYWQQSDHDPCRSGNCRRHSTWHAHRLVVGGRRHLDRTTVAAARRIGAQGSRYGAPVAAERPGSGCRVDWRRAQAEHDEGLE